MRPRASESWGTLMLPLSANLPFASHPHLGCWAMLALTYWSTVRLAWAGKLDPWERRAVTAALINRKVASPSGARLTRDSTTAYADVRSLPGRPRFSTSWSLVLLSIPLMWACTCGSAYVWSARRKCKNNCCVSARFFLMRRARAFSASESVWVCPAVSSTAFITLCNSSSVGSYAFAPLGSVSNRKALPWARVCCEVLSAVFWRTFVNSTQSTCHRAWHFTFM